MKTKPNNDPIDDLRPEYDFTQMKGGVRGKYADSYQEGMVVITLDPDVVRTFPDSKSVNEALRTLSRIVHDNQGTA